MIGELRRRCLAAGLPGYRFGGDSSSSSQNTTQNIDRRQVVDTGSVGVTADSSTITVNSTDSGAVKAATDLLGKTVDTNANNFGAMLSATEKLVGMTIDALDANTKLAGNLTVTTQSAYADATAQANGNKNLVYVGMAVLGLAAITVFGKK